MLQGIVSPHPVNWRERNISISNSMPSLTPLLPEKLLTWQSCKDFVYRSTIDHCKAAIPTCRPLPPWASVWALKSMFAHNWPHLQYSNIRCVLMIFFYNNVSCFKHVQKIFIFWSPSAHLTKVTEWFLFWYFILFIHLWVWYNNNDDNEGFTCSTRVTLSNIEDETLSLYD